MIFGDWYLKYLEKKALLREENYLAKKNERKSIPISTDDVQISYRKKMIQELEKNKFDFIDKHTKNMDRQVLEDTIDSWLKHSEMKKYVTLLKLKRRTIKKLTVSILILKITNYDNNYWNFWYYVLGTILLDARRY